MTHKYNWKMFCSRRNIPQPGQDNKYFFFIFSAYNTSCSIIVLQSIEYCILNYCSEKVWEKFLRGIILTTICIVACLKHAFGVSFISGHLLSCCIT